MRIKNGVMLKPIPVSPNDDYMAGDDGRIYSRTKYAGFGVKAYVDWYPLVGHLGKKGYFHISLCHKNQKVTKSVHRLVCMAFHGMPNPPTLQVRHIDGKPQNCKPSNLKWGTQRDQWRDARGHGTSHEGERHWASKFTNAERDHLRWAIKKGLCSQRFAALVLRVTQASIYGIVHTK